MKKPLHVKLSNILHQKVKEFAQKTGDTQADIVSIALIEYFTKQEKKIETL
jgi:predicted transcriptional regulator